MKHLPKYYAQALLDALQDHPNNGERLADGLISALRKNGDLRRGGEVIAATERLILKRSGGRKIILESARPLQTEELNKLKNQFNSKDRIETRINPDLIAGVKIFIDDEWQLDASFKRKLKKLLLN